MIWVVALVLTLNQVPDVKMRFADGVPERIAQASEAFVKSRIGEERFNKNVLYSRGELDRDGHWAISFIYRIDSIDERLTFGLVMSSDPNIEEPLKVLGIPDCVSDSTECHFPFPRSVAVQIAQAAGLKDSVRPLKVSLYWRTDPGTYAWEIMSTVGDDGVGALYHWCEIDANSGEVLALYYVNAN